MASIRGAPRELSSLEGEPQPHAHGHERRQGELLPERLGEIFLAVQRESLGPAFDFDEEYRHFWCYIPHFIHSPFYVYAYAFGDCLVNSLYAVYERAEAGFTEKYLDLLRAGGTKHYSDLLAPFGLDARDPSFWAMGLGLLERMIREGDAKSGDIALLIAFGAGLSYAAQVVTVP